MNIFQDIQDKVLGVHVEEFAVPDLTLRNPDLRVKYVYIAPAILSLKSYVELEQDLLYYLAKESRGSKFWGEREYPFVNRKFSSANM